MRQARHVNQHRPAFLRVCWMMLALLPLQTVPAEIDAPPALSSIRLVPAELNLSLRHGRHGMRVVGIDSTGLERDVTALAAFSSENPEVAKSEPDGFIRALTPGETVVTARIGTATASTRVHVTAGPSGGVSFVNEVLPILSKAGCNAGSCHAKPQGQNGFKLSVFAHDPLSDYEQIIRASRGRRISPAAPETSLLLQKPTMQINHGGGRRLEPDSPAYATLVRWIQDGTPYRATNDPDLQRIEVFPSDRLYGTGESQPLLVQAIYSDGTSRDVTALADYLSNEKAIADVDPSGRIQTGSQTGEAIIVVRFMGQVAVSRVVRPAARRIPDSTYAALPVRNPIDEFAIARWKRLGLLPSELCSDSEFIRRSSLAAIGRLPTPEEARDFLDDPYPDKRDRWIDRLLEHPSYADHWAAKWGDLIRPNPFRVGVKSVYLMDRWIRESFRRNQPYDEFVRELLTAQGSTHQYGPVVLFRDKREPSDLGSFVSQIFLGVRMDCARCHHHPNEKWSQDDYYQMAAFFARLKRKGQGISAPISGEPEFIWTVPNGEVKHPVTHAVMTPKPPDGEPVQVKEGKDLREALVDWMVDPDNPFFSRAVVNRVWAEFFGRGIVDPVDDFRVSNPPTNPELLDWLAADFVAHDFDLKHLMRTILRSHVYQLSSVPNESNRSDDRHFSRAYRQRLPAEVLLDAVSDVTETAENLEGMAPGAPALRAWSYHIDSHFLDAFGRPNSSSDCPCERETKPSMVQALHLMNSAELQRKIAHPEGRAARLARSDLPAEAIVTELYLAAFSRYPDAEERRIAAAAIVDGDEKKRRESIEDLMWALINTAEFVFNH